MKITSIDRWRTEIQLAEKFRDEEFGIFNEKRRYRTGENIDYFERGFSTGMYSPEDADTTTTLNFFHIITKLIVPSLYFQNPRVTVTPERKVDEDSAPYSRGILNHFYRAIDTDQENELAVWDGYVVNRGITKVGYATRFGMDVPDEKEKKKKSRIDKVLEQMGLKKKEEEEEIIRPEIDRRIIAERPYIKWVSPFKFLIDPRARTINEALWVAEEFDKTVAELKRNKSYKNTADLKGVEPDMPSNSGIQIPVSELEEFSIVKLYEIHYRNDSKYYRIVIVKDGEVYKELYHEESIYKLDDFQYDMIEFNRHGHLQFKRSDLDKIKNLQDRFTSTLDAILDQLDRFQPKIGIDESAITPSGRKALNDGDLGAIVGFNKSPKECIQEIALTQFKADLKAILEEMVNIITIMTGVTRAKLLGVASGDTATGETIAQGGENIRLADMSKEVQRFSNSQASKLWKIIVQFVDLEELEIITGESGVDLKTGKPIYNWLDDIDSAMSDKLINGEYRFNIEVGSTQKVDSALITKRIENLISILARTDVIALMQAQGKKVDVAEILRLWLQNNPEIVRDAGRIIQDVTQNTQGLLPAEDILMGGGRGGMTSGSQINALRKQSAEAPVSMGGMMREAGQV